MSDFVNVRITVYIAEDGGWTVGDADDDVSDRLEGLFATDEPMAVYEIRARLPKPTVSVIDMTDVQVSDADSDPVLVAVSRVSADD